MSKILATLLMTAAAAAGGCAIGQQIPYNQMPRLRTPGAGRVALAVQDWRDEVVSGAKPPNFCGLLRGGYGNPFSVTTASNRPLAADFATVMARGLVIGGFQVVIVPTTPGQGDAVTLGAFATRRVDRSLLIQIRDWKSDTYHNTTLIYRVTAQVRDGQGRVIAQSHIVGNDSLGGRFLGAGDHMKKVVPDATRERLERLLNDPGISKALQGDGAEAPTAEAPTAKTRAPDLIPATDEESPSP